jgi:hypothetical protein
LGVKAAGLLRIALVSAVALGALLFAAPANSAVFMQYEGVEGESSSDVNGLNQPSGIEITSFPFGVDVADTNQHRIHSFSPTKVAGFGVDDGTPVFQTCPPTPPCQGGIFGSGAGQLFFPWGLALDPVSGNVIVSETGNNRGQYFQGNLNMTGTFFGTGGAVGTNLTSPRGLDVAGNPLNDIAVANGDQSVVIYDRATGMFKLKIGWGVNTGAPAPEVCVAPGPCMPGFAGPGPGQLNQPFGVSFGPGNTIFVANTNDNRIDTFNAVTGNFIGTFASGLNQPRDVVVDDAGNVLIANTGANRVFLMDSLANLLGTIGDPGDPGGSLNLPSGVDMIRVGSNDQIGISDTGNNLIKFYTAIPQTPSNPSTPPSPAQPQGCISIVNPKSGALLREIARESGRVKFGIKNNCKVPIANVTAQVQPKGGAKKGSAVQAAAPCGVPFPIAPGVYVTVKCKAKGPKGTITVAGTECTPIEGTTICVYNIPLLPVTVGYETKKKK